MQSGQASVYLLDRVAGHYRARPAQRHGAAAARTIPASYEVDFTLSTEAAPPLWSLHGTKHRPADGHRAGSQSGVRSGHPEPHRRSPAHHRAVRRSRKPTTLALVLRAGALPASIRYLEERTVGPSLGADSIRHGVQASVISLLVVLIFMVVYYRLSGVNAVVALLLNLVILLAALAYFGAVLTLAGHRRRDLDDRHGRGFERADFRAHSRRVARGQGPGVAPWTWVSSARF